MHSARLFLARNVGDSVGEHAVGGCKQIQRLAQQNNLAAGDDAMAKEALMHVPPGDTRLLMNRVLSEGLVRRINVDLDVNELGVRQVLRDLAQWPLNLVSGLLTLRANHILAGSDASTAPKAVGEVTLVGETSRQGRVDYIHA